MRLGLEADERVGELEQGERVGKEKRRGASNEFGRCIF